MTMIGIAILGTALCIIAGSLAIGYILLARASPKTQIKSACGAATPTDGKGDVQLKYNTGTKR